MDVQIRLCGWDESTELTPPPSPPYGECQGPSSPESDVRVQLFEGVLSPLRRTRLPPVLSELELVVRHGAVVCVVFFMVLEESYLIPVFSRRLYSSLLPPPSGDGTSTP